MEGVTWFNEIQNIFLVHQSTKVGMLSSQNAWFFPHMPDGKQTHLVAFRLIISADCSRSMPGVTFFKNMEANKKSCQRV